VPAAPLFTCAAVKPIRMVGVNYLDRSATTILAGGSGE
jgi:hypothetical protein